LIGKNKDKTWKIVSYVVEEKRQKRGEDERKKQIVFNITLSCMLDKNA
jgi:hypothetical protein